MQVHHGIEQLPAFSNAVITIGTFDGVHAGHKKIIHSLTSEADRVNGESILITFHPHPRKVVAPQETLQLINTMEEKIELLAATGIDHLVIFPFTKEFAEQEAENYIQDFLVKSFQPHTIIIGYDHHFGKNRRGNFKLLEDKAYTFGYRLVEISPHALNEVSVSSTKIRKALLHADVATANALLGYQFFFSGKVIKGDQLGRQLGYPTANLKYIDEDKIQAGHGVYAVYVKIDGTLKKGMLSIGTRPTLTESDERVEVNIFDFDEDLYGKTITIIIAEFLRSQEKYESLEVLKQQLQKDKEGSLRVL